MIYKDFLNAGYAIFPLYGADAKGGCECGDPDCEAAFKHPRFPNWQAMHLFDEESIEGLEEIGWFATGYGVLAKGLLVIDVDARNGGVESYARFIKNYPDANTSGFEVYTGSGEGSKHVYFSLPEQISMVQSLPDYPGLDFKTTGYLVGPGSRHKSGGLYEADGYVCDITPAPESIIAVLRRPEYHRSEYNGQSMDVSHADIADMLHYVSNDDLDYETWFRIGGAIHHATQGTGYELWVDWSSTSTKHDEKKMGAKWHSMGRGANPATIGTIIHYAEIGGWVRPVSFVSTEQFTEEPAPEYNDGLPFSITGCSLTQPPGFVGEVAEWIEGQSRRPRRHLSVAAALTAIGNIAGLRYTDDVDGVTTNLFAFCVAGSRTGKESIQQGVMALHRAAGIMGASHGSIKSEQEITRNLTRHQAAFYIIDEIGIFMQKVSNARKRGGAAYLDGVIGMLMSVYSKANGLMALNGDMSEQIKADLVKELSRLNASMANGETPALKLRYENVEAILANLDHGLDRPFLSLIGFTTPVTFDDLVDFESATNGFIGRSLLFNERDTAPSSKDGFKKTPMPKNMEAAVQQIFTCGDYDPMTAYRVEYYGDRIEIPTDDKARLMLGQTVKWLEDKAKEAKSTTGLESLWLGAYELVAKVSLILAVRDGLRTSEHVRWALALIVRDVEEKSRLVVGNERQKDAPKDALAAKIMNILSGEEPERLGVIVNRLRNFRKEDVVTRLGEMVEAGVVQEIVTIHSRQKTEIKKYLAAPA